MEIKETYNIHKRINCIFPHFKSKFLCKKGKHNYQLHSKTITYEPIIEEDGHKKRVEFPREDILYWKCACCGRSLLYRSGNNIQLIKDINSGETIDEFIKKWRNKR